jgi:hypothetical protein
MRVHVASGDQHRFETAGVGPNHAVGKQTPAHLEQDHLVWLHSADVHRTDVEDVGRPYRRKHAGAGDANARFAALIQHLRQQPASEFFGHDAEQAERTEKISHGDAETQRENVS